MAKAKKKSQSKKPSKTVSLSKNKKKPVKKIQKKTALSTVKKKTLSLLKAITSKKKPVKEKKKEKPTKLVLPSGKKNIPPLKAQKASPASKETKPLKGMTIGLLEPIREEIIYNPKFDYIPFNPPLMHKRPGRILTADGFERLYESSHSS